MNILFVTENEISQQLGGTERITITLSDEFTRLGHTCYLAFCKRSDHPDICSFRQTLLLDEQRSQEQLCELLQRESIDIVVSNLVGISYKRRLLPILYAATRGTKARVVGCYHAMPGEDLLGNRIDNSLYRIRRGGSLTANLKDIALTILGPKMVRRIFRRSITRKYRLMDDYSDRIVLHTPEACRQYAQIAGLPFDGRFAAVNSALSYDTFLDEAALAGKARVVLIVARLDEKPKRISFALKAWKAILQDGRFSSWQLKIVGGGPDEAYYRRMARRLGLKNVSFEGRVADLTAYYREASIFLLTSAFEGWALTLTESQQFGVVPVALDSYVSLPTIIKDRETGLIVPDGDMKAFVAAVRSLMADDALRERIARSGLVSCRRFTVDKIARDWLALFEDMLSRQS